MFLLKDCSVFSEIYFVSKNKKILETKLKELIYKDSLMNPVEISLEALDLLDEYNVSYTRNKLDPFVTADVSFLQKEQIFNLSKHICHFYEILEVEEI